MLAPNDRGAALANATRFLRFHRLFNLAMIEKSGQIKGYSVRNENWETSTADWLSRQNGEHNLYTHINPLKGQPRFGKATKADVAAARYFGGDIDPPADFDWNDAAAHQSWLSGIVAKLQRSSIRPSFINCSGWGIQAFWRLAQDVPHSDEKLFAEAEKRAQYHGQQLGADKGVFSFDRLWRVPGTINVPTGKKAKQGRPKKDGFIVEWDNGRTYELDHFPLPPAKPIATVATIARAPSEPPRHIEDRMRRSEIGQRSEDFHAVVCGLADRGFGESEIEAELLRYPDGPAAKYQGRLRVEIRRSLEKRKPQPEARISVAPPPIGHNSASQPTDEPVPLFREMPPAAPFPVEAMGPIMAKATKAFQEEIQAPMAMCGNAVLASAALAVQAHYDVQMPHGIAPTSLYFASVAKSGERKTGTDKKVLKPVREFEDELRKDYDRERRDYLDAKDVWETSRKRTLASKLDDAEKREELKNLGPEPRPPLKPIRAVSDVTAEGLAGLLELMLSGGLFATEGGQFTGGHAMSDDAKLRNAAFFSRLWDDGYVDRVRARQEEVVLRHRRLSVHLQLQPDVAFRFFSDPVLRDQGLHSRFLISYPDSVMGQRQYMPKVSLEHATAQVAFAARIKELLRTSAPIRDEDPFSPDPKPLPLSANAETLFIQYVDQIESELGPNGALAPISGLANKLPEHSARIAAVIAAIEDSQLEEVDEAAVTGGILLASHYAAEARRIALMSQGQIELQEAQGLWDWLDTKWRTEHGHISITDLLWKGPNSIRDKAKAEELVSILESHGYLRPAGEQIIGGKKRRKTWTIWTAAA